MYFGVILIKSIPGHLKLPLNGIIFFPGNKYFRMWSRKGKHWFQITNDLPNSVWGSVHMLKQMFVLCFGSKITHQSRYPQQATCFPFAFSRSPETPLVGWTWSCSSSLNFNLWVSTQDLAVTERTRREMRWEQGWEWDSTQAVLSRQRVWEGTWAGRFSNPAEVVYYPRFKFY